MKRCEIHRKNILFDLSPAGQKFAMMEEKVIIANVLRKFKVESLQTLEEAKPAGQLIVRPVAGKLPVKLCARK